MTKIISNEEWAKLCAGKPVEKMSSQVTLFLECTPGDRVWLCYNKDSGLLTEAQTPREAKDNFLQCISKGNLNKMLHESKVEPAPVVEESKVEEVVVEAAPVVEVEKPKGNKSKGRGKAKEKEVQVDLDFGEA